MNWLTENWIWVLFGVGFIAMHLFGHGGHGGGGGCCGGGGRKNTVEPAPGSRTDAPGSAADPHRH